MPFGGVMLHSLLISNFKSYGESVFVDFHANRSNSHLETLYTDQYQSRAPRITRYNILFGPNGSGKSNLIEAVAFFRYVITRGVPKKGTDMLLNAFHGQTLGTVGSFCVCFTLSEVKQVITYSLSVDYRQHCLVAEKLSLGKHSVYSWVLNDDGFPQASVKTSFFSTKSDREAFIRKVDDFEAAKRPDETLLHVLCATKKDVSKLNGTEVFFRPILSFFSKIIIFSPMPHEYADIKDVLAGDGVNTDSVMRILQQLGIKARKIRLEQVSIEAFSEETGISVQDLEELSVELKKDIEPGEKKHFIYLNRPFYYGLENDRLTFYKLVLEYENRIKLDFVAESSGNQKIINMAPIIFAGSPRDAVFLIDEIDRSLHSSLVKELVRKIISTNAASTRQFVFTAHDPNLLDVNLLRKDELFFAANVNNQTVVKRLDETGIRIDRDIRKKFIDGKITADSATSSDQ